ncbi:MAG TPA: hypothetical protein VJN63_02380 [Thermoplasmata archaeon]|nr:hypothetical protein [Thermoplasmata archaeon]
MSGMGGVMKPPTVTPGSAWTTGDRSTTDGGRFAAVTAAVQAAPVPPPSPPSPTAPLNPEEMLRFHRRNALLSVLVGAALIVGVAVSWYSRQGWGGGSTVLLVFAALLVGIAGYILTPVYAHRFVAKYTLAYESVKSGPTPELMRASLRTAVKALAVALVAVAIETPIAMYFWSDGALQPWLFALLGVTVLWALIMVIILIRGRRWR